MTEPVKKLVNKQSFAPFVVVIDDHTMRGMSIRLDMLQTHYKQPKNFNLQTLNAVAKTLRRWYAHMEPSRDLPPVELIAALEDDLNTPKAITLLHMYAKTNPRALYTGLVLLGLIPGCAMDDPHEWKTIPIDHIALPAWEWETERIKQ